jgi:hypothetical protein
MSRPEDADGLLLPSSVSSLRSQSQRTQTGEATSGTGSVRHPSYRENNLGPNGVCIRSSLAKLPDHISCHFERLRVDWDLPTPADEQIDEYLHKLDKLEKRCTEKDVEFLFRAMVFPDSSDPTYGSTSGLHIEESSPMYSHFVPDNPLSDYRVTQPKPDLLYGYSGDNSDGAFTGPESLILSNLSSSVTQATAGGIRFPFSSSNSWPLAVIFGLP